MTKPAESLRVLLTDLIDYAGLFPPAALDMQSAVANYARYLRGEYAWMLGRFVLPASRLAEFEQALPENEPQPWRLSVLLGPKLEEDVAALKEFAPCCSKLTVIDCGETKVASVEQVEKMDRMIGSPTTAYYEVPFGPELPSLLDAIKSVNGRAKIRTGGVTADAIPSSESVANFLVECARRELPFKATAGLHHPLRCVKPLTYEANAPSGTMHGFLNLFLVATSCYCFFINVSTREDSFDELPSENVPIRMRTWAAYLSAEHPKIIFTDEFASIKAEFPPESDGLASRSGRMEFPTSTLFAARRNFAISFGSCSFEEPIADLKALNLL